jgi:RimJ/RimL family protein N-acetyltransferase
MGVIDSPPRIETDRLVLRAPVMGDAARIAALADDFDIARMTTHMPYPYALYDAQAFIGRIEAADLARDATFAIEHHDAGVVGMVGFHSREGLGPEIGYWVGRPYWGDGIASEAARAALKWAGREWRKRIVVSGHFADNPASGRVLVKAGFLYTGEVQPRRSAARGEIAATRMMVWLA